MLQESWLFSGTVRKHQKFNEYDDDHLLKMCKVAGVDDFVGAHPKGYDLEIKERVWPLVARTSDKFARLIHDPRFIIRRTHELNDQTTEKKVVGALQEISTENNAYCHPPQSNLNNGR